MNEDSGTRSSLLWQVKRLLQECNELPQILMMENVTQVHSTKNMPDFQKWIDFLDSIGYVSTYADLNAKDFGVPQSRNRCFMFSFLKSEFGENPQYEFPEPIPLDKKLKDVLEDKVDEKFYLNNDRAKTLIDQLILDGKIDPSKECVRQRETIDLCYTQASTVDIANGITARYDAGICKHKYERSGVCEYSKSNG